MVHAAGSNERTISNCGLRIARAGDALLRLERESALGGFRQDVEAAIPALRRYARALTRDAELADDLVQDTLVRALRSEHLFHGGDSAAGSTPS